MDPQEPPMNSGKTLFAQLMDHLPWTTFARIVKKYHGDADRQRGVHHAYALGDNDRSGMAAVV
jgi:Domain of unknown function (DUF4372)